MFRYVLILTLAAPLAAQELFPRLSLTASSAPSEFETNVRIDPDDGSDEGTLVSFERDLGLADSRTLPRFTLQWRPFARHELAATHFNASREGFEVIDREIVFRDEVYPVQAVVTTQFDLDYWSATYTYWARRSDRDGIGITLGVATLAFDAAILAETAGSSVTITQEAETDVPVALAGLQGRVAFTNRIHGEASVSTLPRVTIGDYTGSALTGGARVEYRPLRWLGIGASYNYFRLDVDVAQADLSGSLEMKIQGPEAYVRLAF
ncbi:MAG TPA: hypothetical protein VHL59_15280 [Thermoanaerobaculia bacterium]|nr:hypothetical protein [Thermoanaerobaculia bacterium]